MARHETELKRVSEPDGAVADVVFVHGLGGGWDKTWRHKKTGWSWPEWLAAQNRDHAVCHSTTTSLHWASVFAHCASTNLIGPKHPEAALPEIFKC